MRKNRLETHIERVHSNVRLPCDQCEFQATSVVYLKEHKESKHLGIRYQCDKCPASYNIKRNLQQHYALKHSGRKILCDQCEFTTDANSRLQKHIMEVHTNTMEVDNKEAFPCERCDFKAFFKAELKRHCKMKHPETSQEDKLKFQSFIYFKINLFYVLLLNYISVILKNVSIFSYGFISSHRAMKSFYVTSVIIPRTLSKTSRCT